MATSPAGPKAEEISAMLGGGEAAAGDSDSLAPSPRPRSYGPLSQRVAAVDR